MNSFKCVLFLLHCNGITGSIATFMFKKKPVRVSDILELRSYFPEKESRSPIECSRSCSRQDGCISLIFDKESQECRIFNSDIAERKRMETGDVDRETRWVYYHIIKECGPHETFCPKDYVFTPELCFCFKYVAAKSLSNNAVTDCQGISAQSSQNAIVKSALVKIDSQAKQDKLADYLRRSQGFNVSDEFVLIQGEKFNDRWLYDDGTPLKYFNWALGESESGEGYQYITLSVRNFSWYSRDNESEYPYLCEIFPPEYLTVQ